MLFEAGALGGRVFVEADLEDAADEGVAVGVQAVGGQADERVALADGRAVDDRVTLDDADDEANEVEVALPVGAGHVGRLAAEEGAPTSRQASTQPFTSAALASSDRPLVPM